MWVKLAAAAPARRVLAGCLCGALLALACGSTARADDTQAAPESDYRAKARVTETPKEGEAFSEVETSQLEQSLGDAFSLVESMAGVVPVFSGVPYLIVRGATPAGSLNYYDGLQLPALFHVALGPSIIERHLLGQLHYYPGLAPARYGAHIGAVVSRDGPDPSALTEPVRSLKLTLLDVSGYLNVPSEDGSLSIAWRYGNPGLMLSALNLNATLNYYNYQIRYETALAPDTRLLLLALGDGDALGDRTSPKDDISLSFQRVLARITHRSRELTYAAELMLGADASTLGHELNGHALRIKPGLYAEWHEGETRFRVGAEMTAALASLKRGPNTIDTGSRDNRITLDPADFLDGQPYSDVPTRLLTGVYAELHLAPFSHFQVDLGLRADLFMAGSSADPALSPTLALSYHLSRRLELHAGAAIVHKPRTSPLPIPGLDDIALDAGIETAVQTEAGVTYHFDEHTQVDVTAFYHRYLDVVYLELILDCQGNTDPAAAQALLTQQNPQTSICRRPGLPTANGEGHGVEFLLKRDFTHDLSAFITYSLAFASATAGDGTHFTPQADVRHLVNAVLRYDLGSGFSVGLRMHYRTGKMAVNTIYDLSQQRFERVEHRLPGFLRGDAYASYAWRTSFARMEASIGLQNFTFSREATNRNCSAPNGVVTCEIDYQPYIVLPNAGLRADF
jgi:outer membrane receptor protein involved in Fe transport